MELRHLRYFVAVAEELNFHRAADRLHVAQPALGRQVRDLEEEIGARLFERDRRRVALTDAGRVFLHEAGKVLAGAETALHAAREAARGLRGALRIGVVGTLTASVLPASLSAFNARYPQVETDVSEMGPDEQYAALASGDIQVGFQAMISNAPEPAGFAKRRVLACGVSVALPARHPLAARKTLAIGMLAHETFLALQPRASTIYEQWLREVCQEIGGFIPRIRRRRVESRDTMFGLVAAGEGLAIMAEVTMPPPLPGSGWVARPIRSSRPLFELFVVWNPANPSVVLSNYLSILAKGQDLTSGEVSTRQGSKPAVKRRRA